MIIGATMSDIIAGIDPGLLRTGFGIIKSNGDELSLLDYGCIIPRRVAELSSRLNIIHKELTALFKKFNPQAVAVENIFYMKNVRTALELGHMRGVAILVAANIGIPVYEYTPLEVKQAVVGYGRAEKEQIQHMVKNILRLGQIPEPADAADALAVAICHVHYTGGLLGKINYRKLP